MALSDQRWLCISILIPLVGMLFSCEQNGMEKVKALSGKDEVPLRTTYGVKMTYADSGETDMKLFAEKMDHFEGRKGARIKFRQGFRVLFFESEDSIASELEAQKGTLYEGQSRMIARNDVVVRNSDGERLNTEKLVWDQDSGKVYSDKFVKITRSDGVIHGKGLVAEEDLSSYRIKEITGEWYFDRPEQGRPKESKASDAKEVQ